MYSGIPKGLMRLSRRLVGPRNLNRVMRQMSDLMNLAPELPGKPARPARPAPPPPAPQPAPRPAQAAPISPAPISPAPIAPAPIAEDLAGEVAEVMAFGSNPGALRMLMYAPPTLPESGAPLVVVLHGCGQHAAQFAAESGWLALAARLGFAVVMPEQVAANNAGRCFNWFRAEDIARGEGEALSIREMVETAIARALLDATRIYVVGLSAGGAMAAALLAAYPELFAAGASVAGLPVGCASDVTSAFAQMARPTPETPEILARRARAIGPAAGTGRWPRISIWQGDADHTVVPDNAGQMAAQFAALHGIAGPGAELPPHAPLTGQVASQVTGRVWQDGGGIEVELRSIAGMAHGYPIVSGTPVDRFVLPVGIDATAAIAGFWGLHPRR